MDKVAIPPADDRYLRAFHAVCRAGTLSAAALALHRSQPTLSYQLRQLEHSLGTTLFERRGRRLMLTPAGETLRDFCERFYAEYARLRSGFPAASPTPRPLRIAAVSGYGRHVLVPRLAACLEAEVAPQVSFPPATEVFARVRDGAADIGFAHYRSSSRELRCIRVFTERLVLVYPRRWQMPDADALGGLPFVTYDESDALVAQWFLGALRRPPPKYRGAAHFEEIEEALYWVAQGRGVTVVPDFCVPAAAHGVAVLDTPRACRNAIHAVLPAGAVAADAKRLLAALKATPAGAGAGVKGRRNRRT